jgi:two-component system response regulator GlrR
VGTSRAVQTAVEQIAVAGRGRFPVWIAGAAGVDTELIARLVHDASEWTDGDFFALDAKVVPIGLMARELFGAEAGAIPAVPEAAPGAFGRTSGGTVLLENVDAVPKELQQTLAGVLQQNRYRRVGGSEDLPVESRLIASCTLTLEEVTGAGRLAPELSEQLRLLEITIPPLAERREDIVPIAAHTLSLARAEIEHETGVPCRVRGFTAQTLERLVSHSWPENERDLRAQVRTALQMAGGEDIEPGDLALGWDSLEGVPPFREAKRAFEREYVTRVLRMCGGNISKAARIARKDRKDFYDVMRRNSIVPSEFRG